MNIYLIAAGSGAAVDLGLRTWTVWISSGKTREWSSLPIIVISAEHRKEKVQALDEGDDYVTSRSVPLSCWRGSYRDPSQQQAPAIASSTPIARTLGTV